MNLKPCYLKVFNACGLPSWHRTRSPACQTQTRVKGAALDRGGFFFPLTLCPFKALEGNRETEIQMIQRRQRISGSELLRNQRSRETHDTEETQEVPPLGASVKTLQEAAQRAIIDKSPGDPVFKLCRALRGFELSTGQSLSSNDLGSAFSYWWNFPGARANLEEDLSYDEWQILFLEAFKVARTPLGANVIETAVRNINYKKAPPEAGRYSSPRLKRLVHLCFELQLLNGDAPFFLGSRDAGNVIGCAHIHAAGFLRGLVSDGVLTLVSVGHRGKASRYKFNLKARKND